MSFLLFGNTFSFYFFFFSSRRRHTRLQGDWSSDVCSSDLDPRPPVEEPPPAVETVSPEGRGEKRPRPDREGIRSEEHTSELQSPCNLVCRLLLEKKKKKKMYSITPRNQHNMRERRPTDT